MTRFYSNENFLLNLVKELRRLGYDVLTSYEAGQANQSISDENVLRFAQEIERVVITLNREDFITLDKQSKAHNRIFICKEDRDYQGQAEEIHECILKANQSLKGRLIRIKKQNQKGASAQVFVIQNYS